MKLVLKIFLIVLSFFMFYFIWEWTTATVVKGLITTVWGFGVVTISKSKWFSIR